MPGAARCSVNAREEAKKKPGAAYARLGLQPPPPQDEAEEQSADAPMQTKPDASSGAVDSLVKPDPPSLPRGHPPRGKITVLAKGETMGSNHRLNHRALLSVCFFTALSTNASADWIVDASIGAGGKAVSSSAFLYDHDDMLTMGCTIKKDTDFSLRTKAFDLSGTTHRTISVTFQLDKSAPRKQTWKYDRSDHRYYVTGRRAERFIMALGTANNFTFAPSNVHSQPLNLALLDVARAAGSLKEVCKWKPL